MGFTLNSNSLAGLQGVYDGGTPAQKAAFRSSVSGDTAPLPMLAAVIGDSRNAQALHDQSAGGVTKINWANTSGIYWLRFLSHCRVRIPEAYVKAVSGDTTAQIAGAQLASVLALTPRPSLCFINGGTNSFSASATYAQVLQSAADIQGAATALRAAGITPVIELDTPRTLASWNASAQKCSIAYNRIMRSWCRDNGVRCADTECVFIGAGGDPVAGYQVADGIHQAQTGALIRGKALFDAVADLLEPYYPSGINHPLDIYDAALNPGGNCIPGNNGLMTGTGGANSGSGASGPVATGYTSSVTSGTLTAVASKISPRADGRLGGEQQFVISATAAGAHRFAPASLSTGATHPAGTAFVAGVDIEISALSGVVDYVQLNVFDFDGSTQASTSIAGRNPFGATLNPMPVIPLLNNTGAQTIFPTLRGRLETAPIIVGQGITSASLIWRLETSLQSGASVTYKAGQASIRRV